MSRTKIICTIGPACDQPDTLRAMLAAGMRVARLNFSHGTAETHRATCERLRQAASETGIPLCILQDLSGPKIRIGQFAESKVFLKPGDRFILTRKPGLGDGNQVHVALKGIVEQVEPGQRVLLADGLIELEIQEVLGEEIVTEVQVGGWLSDRKGISFPGCRLGLQALTAKDREDLQTGLALGVDYIALSFVRKHEDIEELKELIAEAGKQTKVIAKLERPEALDDLDAILKVADGVMVARGDLGIELEPEKVPLVQKHIIREARRRNVYVITATQMLESMVHHPWPTRAETSDVANAVLDGTDAVMLSGETATGAYPVRAVQIMERIAREIETAADESCDRRLEDRSGQRSFAASIGWAAGAMARMTSARAICAFTFSGATAQLISKTHPAMNIIGLTPNEMVQRQLNLAWGVEPILVHPVPGVDEMIAEVERVVLERGMAGEGDTVVIVAGYPLLQPGLTNLIKLHCIGKPDPGESYI